MNKPAFQYCVQEDVWEKFRRKGYDMSELIKGSGLIKGMIVKDALLNYEWDVISATGYPWELEFRVVGGTMGMDIDDNEKYEVISQ